MLDFKLATFGDIEAFITLSAEQYQAKVGGKKGNASLVSFDGRYKVIRAMADNIAFDERLQAAKALIDECLHEWTEGARAEVITLINDAFRVDQAGNIRTGSVLALRRLQIDDERWQRAMQAIGEAVQVVSTKAYVRIQERVGDTDQYRSIPLDIAGCEMAKEINIDTIMSQAQVFASAWSLVGAHSTTATPSRMRRKPRLNCARCWKTSAQTLTCSAWPSCSFPGTREA